MAKIVYRQMPAPRELPQQIPAPWATARMQNPQGGGKFVVQIPGVRRGDSYGWNWYLHNTLKSKRVSCAWPQCETRIKTKKLLN